MASAMEEPDDPKYGKEPSEATRKTSVRSESSGEAEHHEGVWTVAAAFRCDGSPVQAVQGGTRP